MTPSANRRTPDYLADEIGVAGGKVAPTIPDDCCGRYHLLDFGMADAQALVAVRIRQPTTSREQNASRIANRASPTKRDW
jgi:hypothetical protein